MTGPVVDTEFEGAVRFVENAIETVRNAWNDIVAAVRAAIAAFPILAEPLMDDFNALTAKVTEALDFLWKLVTERGDATAIRQVGSDWTTAVGGPVNEQAADLHPGGMPSTGQWSGVAATKYFQVVLNQRQALMDVKPITDDLQLTLNEIADAIKTFWTFLAVETAGWVAMMVACAFTAALGGIAAALIASVTYVGLVTKHSNDLANTLDTKKAKLEQLSTAGGSFASGPPPGFVGPVAPDANKPRWPSVPSTDLGDASVLDEDGVSDWTPTATS